jgi:hypothetical protein
MTYLKESFTLILLMVSTYVLVMFIGIVMGAV